MAAAVVGQRACEGGILVQEAVGDDVADQPAEERARPHKLMVARQLERNLAPLGKGGFLGDFLCGGERRGGGGRRSLWVFMCTSTRKVGASAAFINGVDASTAMTDITPPNDAMMVNVPV